jgi:hypothetical protein
LFISFLGTFLNAQTCLQKLLEAKHQKPGYFLIQSKYPNPSQKIFQTIMGNAILTLQATIKELRYKHHYFTQEDIHSFIRFLARERRKAEIAKKNPFAELYGLEVPHTLSEIISFNQQLHDFAKKNKHLTQYDGTTFIVPSSQLKVSLISPKNPGLEALIFTDILSESGRHNLFYSDALIFLDTSHKILRKKQILDLPGPTKIYPTITIGILKSKKEIDTILVMHPPVKARVLENNNINKLLLQILNEGPDNPEEDFNLLAKYFFYNAQLPPFVLGTPSITEALADSILRAKYDLTFPEEKIYEPFWGAVFWEHREEYKMKDWLDNYK